MRWRFVVEPSVFGPAYARWMPEAIRKAKHDLLVWDDSMWDRVPELPEDQPVLFHGSLNNAVHIREELPQWQPGVFCNVEALHCSAYYPKARRWLLNEQYEITTVRDLVAHPERHAFGANRVFVRPDSPLKPFSGRVVPVEGLTLATLDHGYYYDDVALPVLVAPVKDILREWRLVIVDEMPYCVTCHPGQDPFGAESMAYDIARGMAAPDRIYVADIAETPEGYRLVELNPFSGADIVKGPWPFNPLNVLIRGITR